MINMFCSTNRDSMIRERLEHMELGHLVSVVRRHGEDYCFDWVDPKENE